MKYLVLSFVFISFTIQAAENTSKQPPNIRSIDRALAQNEEPSLSDEEQKFLEEEFQPPQEAPYTEDVNNSTSTAESKIEQEFVRDETDRYASDPEAKLQNEKFEQKGLKKVYAKGAYQYETTSSPQNWGARFRIAPFAPPNLSNSFADGTSISFYDIYGRESSLVFLLEFEYLLMKLIGKFSLVAGSGFYSASGNGRFRRDTTLIAREEYTFYMMPNRLGGRLALDFSEKQFLVPYATGGGYYFTFLESRDDGAPYKYGGALAAYVGAGLGFKLDALDRQGVTTLDVDYGVNHVYAIAEFEQVVGLNSQFNFSGQIFSGGLLLEF